MRYTRREMLAALGAGALAGCTRLQAPGSGSGRTQTSLLLNWKPNGLHVPYFVARERGYYRDNGIALQTIETGQGSDFSAQQVGLGNKNFVVTSGDQIIRVNSADLAPLSVATVMQRSPVVLFTTRETFGGRFQRVEQLAGKTVGTGPGMVRILSKLLLESAGVLSDVELVDTGFDTVQQLLSGEIDTAGGVFGDAISARAQDYTTDSIPVASAIPSYGHVIATNREFAGENPDAVVSFLRATARGASWAHQNPGSATDVLVGANDALQETRAQQRQKWETMADQFMLSETVRQEGWGVAHSEPWQVTADALREAELLDGPVTPADVWTNEYLDTSYEYIGSYANQLTTN